MTPRLPGRLIAVSLTLATLVLAASPLQETSATALAPDFEVVSEDPVKVKLAYRNRGRVEQTPSLEATRLRLRAKAQGCFRLRWVSKVEGEEIAPMGVTVKKLHKRRLRSGGERPFEAREPVIGDGGECVGTNLH